MSDDIVTQLVMFSLDDGTDALNKLLVEAVNEIERLRKVNDKFCDEVKTWRKLALAEHWLRVPDHLACDCLDKWVHDGM